jgi:hypothetical protein
MQNRWIIDEKSMHYHFRCTFDEKSMRNRCDITEQSLRNRRAIDA